MARSAELTAFLEASALALRTACDGPARQAAETVIARWQTCGEEGGAGSAWLPVCDYIGPAVAAAQLGERALLAQTFLGIYKQLFWKRRDSAPASELAFWNGHANAVVLGPGGLEARDDLWIGATVMAPGIRYVDHDHPPEEVYLSLTPGEWWNAQMDWIDPGPAGFVYNPPGIAHAMRSGSGPFLALWYLPL